MTRHLLIAMALGVCALAAADVRIFVTSSAAGYGLDLLGPQGDGTGTDPLHDDWPIDPFRPTYSTVDSNGDDEYAYDHYYAYYRVGAYPPIDAPSGTVDNPILINGAAGEWAYIWFQFRDEPWRHVNDMITVATLAGQSEATQDLSITYYVQNNLWDDQPGGGRKRWWGEATPPDYPWWHVNPKHFTTDLEWGIANSPDDPQMLFDSQAINGSYRTGVALLGALGGSAGDAVYELTIDEIGYDVPPYPDVGESCFFRIVPEPAGALLVAVATLWIRPRRS